MAFQLSQFGLLEALGERKEVSLMQELIDHRLTLLPSLLVYGEGIEFRCP